jgi:predicted site-specific integrase-resolvase
MVAANGARERLVTGRELIDALAGEVEIKPQTLRLWARQGHVPGVKVGPKGWRFRVGEVRRALGLS